VHVESIISAFPGRISYFELMPFLCKSARYLIWRYIQYPYHLQTLTIYSPTASNPAVSTPVVINPVTENRSICVVMSV